MNTITHEPVMIEEAIEALNIRKNFLYVDATFGLGGYAKKILKTEGRINWNENAKKVLAKIGQNVVAGESIIASE